MKKYPQLKKTNRRNRRLIVFNKPYGVLCQFSGSEDDTLLKDYISIPNVYPAGRLDKDSEGLLLLTDDGQLQAEISHPKFKMPKVYWTQVEGNPSQQALNILRTPVQVNGVSYGAAQVAIIAEPDIWPRIPPIRERKDLPTTWLEIIISEGKNRQVRKMTAHIGYPTLRLIRAKIGDWDLQGLSPGSYKEIKL